MFYDTNLEKILLGILIIKPKNINLVEESMFNVQLHKYIFREISNLYKQNNAVDLAVVTSRVAKYGGKSSYTASLLDGVPYSCNNIESIVTRLKELRQKRRLYVNTQQLQEILKRDDLESLPAIIDEIKKSGDGGGRKDKFMSAGEMVEKFETYISQGEGVKIGIPSIDHTTNGIAGGEVLCFMARAKVGKSIFTQNVLRYFTIHYPGDSAILFNLEMSAPQIGERMLMIETGKTRDEIKDIDQKEREEIITRHGNIFYLTPSFMTLNDIYSAVVNIQFKANVRLVIIDFLTRIKTNIMHEYDALRLATKFIKDMAKELNIAIIVLVQAGRAEGGGGYNPLKLESGRGSGTIEEDADFIIAAYRPELNPYLRETDRWKVKNILVLQMLGSRRTPIVPKIELYFDKSNLRLRELERAQEMP